MYFGKSVDDDLTMGNVYTGRYKHRVTDTYLADHHGQAMRYTRQDRYPYTLHRCFHTIKNLGEEGITHPYQPHHMKRKMPA